ncbi:hypothetical protein H2203_001141 [Taxawa tesnikishii (nom. ined.)]|nr:hypothetical protein H2203_001141 [Dothideales sp. JES 119]
MSSIVTTVKGELASATTQSAPEGHHIAAISTEKGVPLTLTHLPTPTPGPDELLVEIKAVAMNPIDYYQRDLGFPPITHYPSVLGHDMSGIVIAAGSSVSGLKPGARVAGLGSCYDTQGKPEYGAFQQKTIIPATSVVELPDSIGFAEATLLPMAVLTFGKGMLVWGGASSIGSAAVQIASMLGFTVYVTASEKHHEYLRGLGASRLFDYKAENAMAKIVEAAKEDGVTLDKGFDAVGEMQSCLDILKEFAPARLAEASAKPYMSGNPPKVDGVDAAFSQLPKDGAEKAEYSQFVARWLKEKLEKGEYVPSPHLKVVQGGLESLNEALDELRAGVSGQKLVIEVWECIVNCTRDRNMVSSHSFSA